MRVFQVVETSLNFQFEYSGTAGTEIQPPIPVNLMIPLCANNEGVSGPYYKAAVDGLTSKLKHAYDGEKELVAQRDDIVKKVNTSIRAQNDLTVKYNELVDRFNKLQATTAAQK